MGESDAVRSAVNNPVLRAAYVRRLRAERAIREAWFEMLRFSYQTESDETGFGAVLAAVRFGHNTFPRLEPICGD